jgi:Arc/MetJ-type ribon-helix-helix transcriptional regulator
MATVKVTVTLMEDQMNGIRTLIADGQASTISGFVQHAVKIALADAAGWDQMLLEALDQTGGALTPRERSWADSALSGAAPKRHSKPKRAA